MKSIPPVSTHHKFPPPPTRSVKRQVFNPLVVKKLGFPSGAEQDKHFNTMNINLYQPSSDIANRELLFIGFSGDFDANISNFPYQSDEYNYEIINNPFKAYHWLEQKVDSMESYQPPYAIFLKLQWLISNDFRLIRQIMAHPDLKFLPLIVLSEQGDVFDVSMLMQNGIDDCYTIPIEWNMLESRLEFLNQYKPKLLEQAKRTLPEVFAYKIPLGKRIFDILVASTVIILSSIFWIPVVFMIAYESGWPVIYKSKRAGTGYNVFNFLKFRSMFKDADQRLKELQHLNQYKEGTGSVFVKFANDPRITSVGKFIRKYSIDELPQLLNVIKGDMSIVGNRPLPLYEAELLTSDEWSARFMAPAGLTGLWQVTKRGSNDMSMEERIALDIQYAKNYSVLTDVRIILKTFTAFIQKEDV
jgi:lipopolysaccharide/colanic/teichoic acid biosynthesis glycosyltransferase